VLTALDALTIAPELFTPQASIYLGLRSIYYDLNRAKSDDALREVVARMWAMAVQIEDGDISEAEQALRAAQDALREALDRNASDDEIKKLTDQLRATLDKFLQALAEQMRKNPQQLSRPLDKNSRMLSQQDLKSMIDRLENMAKLGNKDAARQLLDQLQSMLENLQTAQQSEQGDEGDDDMMSALDELGDMIRKQQQLRDKTFKQGQDARRDRQRGKQGNQAMGDLQQDQQGLRDRLNKLQQELARRGMGQGQRGEKGQGADPEQGEGENGLGDADSAMDDAGGKLGEGNADGAVYAQGKALEGLRKGAQSLADSMQPGDGNQPGDGQGNRIGRQQSGGNQSDPLGRPLHGREFGDDLTVKIPGEIDVQRVRRILEELRRRLADPSRPQTELDYIERLLKDY
jgi:uncharacterized protein (TIGR02302 family)